MYQKISIIIPSVNEGEQMIKTVQSIQDTVPKGKYEIIVINDGSDTWEKIPGVTTIHHEITQGRPVSVHEGVEKAKYEAILILNARMRFTEGWLDKYIDHLNKYPEGLVCATCVYLSYGDEEITDDKPRKYGSSLAIYDSHSKLKFFNNKWNTDYPEDGIVDVCLGASTAMTKKWWNKIHGLKGLYSWGSADAFLALKTKLAGGKCRVMKDVEIGNIFRGDYYEGEKKIKTKQHYPASPTHTIYNKMYMLYILFPNEVDRIYEYSKMTGWKLALLMWVNNLGRMKAERNYLNSIKKLTLKF